MEPSSQLWNMKPLQEHCIINAATLHESIVVSNYLCAWYSGNSVLLTHHNDTQHVFGRCELANGELTQYTSYLFIPFSV